MDGDRLFGQDESALYIGAAQGLQWAWRVSGRDQRDTIGKIFEDRRQAEADLEPVRRFIAEEGDESERVELVWRRVGTWQAGEPDPPTCAPHINTATGQLTVREHIIDLPEQGTDLTAVADFPDGMLRGFALIGHQYSGLVAAGLQLARGKIEGLTAPGTRFEDARFEDVEFTGCDLTRAVFTDMQLTRVRFIDCTLTEASFELVHAADVTFEDCRIGSAQFDVLITDGPLAFLGSGLRETAFTACKLGRAVMHECDLQLTEFDAQGEYEGLDLRGNDVAALLGITNLHRATVSLTQARAMAEALISHAGLRIHADAAKDTVNR
jgi:uncharacterized protein YjbI with pentapeptide repeats